MRIQGAVIEEQGVTFAIVVVKRRIVSNSIEADRAIQAFQPIFPDLPIVLMAQDTRGAPTYYGRQDIAQFLADVPMSAIPWKEYTIG